ncbi:MAG: GTP-binding protein [Burkholderiales bacterium]
MAVTILHVDELPCEFISRGRPNSIRRKLLPLDSGIAGVTVELSYMIVPDGGRRTGSLEASANAQPRRATGSPARRAAGIGPIESLGRIRPLFHDDVRTQTLRFAGPSVWGDVSAMIAGMADSAGHTLLRVKGVLRLADHAEPMVVQWAGGRVSPIEPLPGALAEGDAGYLVIITAERKSPP